MTTLALAILSVGTLYCIGQFKIQSGGYLYYAPAIYGIACLISAFV